jgi:high-affinity iron transporter
MFQSLVITLREGVEAALIVGIVLGYLRKVGRGGWNRIVYWALATAVAASLVLGYILHRLEVTELGDAYEGGLMLLGAVFVGSMVYWMWKTGKRMKQEIEEKLHTLASAPARGAALGLFAFVFLMVFREGIETVLFLAAVSLRSSSELMEFMGGVLGLALAAGFGIAFFKGSLRVNVRRFFSITTLILVLVAVQLFVSGLHELSEAEVLPSSRAEMFWVGRLVNNDLLFFIIVVALCVFLVVAQQVRASGAKAEDLARLPAPERRKLLAAEKRDRSWKLAASAVGLAAIVLASLQFVYSRVAQAVSPPELVSVRDGAVRIPVAKLQDHKLHHFAVTVGGTQVRLIAILDSTDTVRAAMDACLICGSQGYYQDGQNVICRNCGAAIYVPTIGAAGGCNPAHLDPPYQVQGATLMISETALQAAARHFQ